MTPKSIHGFYKPLQTIMQPIKENENMKNLKSLTDFSVNESEINEDYIELMPEIANALGVIQSDWDRWKNGPMTEPSDIKPAAKELKGWITRWMKQTIK
jgi:hypothetical protein